MYTKPLSGKGLTLGSLFDGIGVFPLAARQSGIIPLWASEIDRAAVSITKRHFPDMLHMGDISALHGGEIPPVDLITFGSPCQNLSFLGNRKGLKGEQSSLFFQAVRIIEEMREATGGKFPAVIIWENVMGAFFSNNGMDFRAVLEALTRHKIPMPDTGWQPAGMVCGRYPEIAWRVLDAQHFSTAQRRKRVFLVGDYRGNRAGKILFEPCRMLDNIEAVSKSRMPDAPADRNRTHAAGREIPDVCPMQNRKMRGAAQHGESEMFLKTIGRPDNACPTLMCNDIQIVTLLYPAESEHKNVMRYLTPLEYERLMCLPDGWTQYGHDGKTISDTARYRALGNSIVLPCARFIMQRITNQLLGEGDANLRKKEALHRAGQFS